MEATLDESLQSARGKRATTPGVVVIFTGNVPWFRAVAMPDRSLVIGRELAGEQLPDERVSREHVEVTEDLGQFRIRDLGSRNGTFVDGAHVDGSRELIAPRVVRMGHTLLLLRHDIEPYLSEPLACNGSTVVGPRLATAYREIERAAQSEDVLLIQGETGTGKELAARRFHKLGSNAAGPFVAVNCATIPTGLAERLLFGARKGAYSGATQDSEGYVQAAERGVLFLDEVGELEPQVQAKLLRVVETREVQPIGAARAKSVQLRFCAATHRDLRGSSFGGDFRTDLFFRLAQRQVYLPALSDRLEELPWLVAGEASRSAGPLRVHARFIEACALRAWPGNLRELGSEVRRAVDSARAAGADTLRSEHLHVAAGTLGEASQVSSQAPAIPDAALVAHKLKEHGGNLSAVARDLGLHRTQLYRLLRKLGLEPT